MGLIPEHHGELSSPSCPRERFVELRHEYRDDYVALQYIDVYDSQTAYHIHFGALRDAWVRKDEGTISREETWLKQHYPDIRQNGSA
ncbi:MAG: hypothetical protein AABX14_03130 [Candidatus Aenigmatarchaeota archaeon]